MWFGHGDCFWVGREQFVLVGEEWLCVAFGGGRLTRRCDRANLAPFSAGRRKRGKSCSPAVASKKKNQSRTNSTDLRLERTHHHKD